MGNKIGKGILTVILAAAVILGAYLGLLRYFMETGERTVDLVVDLNELKKAAAYEKKPLGPALDEVRKMGITSIGVFEETFSDAGALGELYCAKGAGIRWFKGLSPVLSKLEHEKKIRPDRTYIYIPDERARKRILNQLQWVLGEKTIKFLNKEVLEVNEAEEELRPLGLGISELQQKYLEAKGFQLVPRVWNDPRYHIGNIEPKISGLKDFRLIIFDGEEILGAPDNLAALASALKKYSIKYGYVEIVKQEGDRQLRRLMGEDVVRAHSVPKNELKKISKEEALDRFVRAVRERNVRLIYLRCFLPPQVDAYPLAYNLKYFGEVKEKLEAAGCVLGETGRYPLLQVESRQVLLLSAGVIIGGLFLAGMFMELPFVFLFALFIILASALSFLMVLGYALLVQKLMAFAAAIIFPSYAVVMAFAKDAKEYPFLLILRILKETFVGIFLMVGLLADYRFILGVEVFPAVKLALVLPALIVFAYFMLKSGEGSLKERLQSYLETKVSLGGVLLGGFVLAALAVLVARSGNFVLPVPAFEKHFRNWLEWILFVRPRTKEFFIGYPALYLAAFYGLKGDKRWIWLLAAIGVVAPISVFNTFSHIHTPLLISLVRTFNGAALGILLGMLLCFFMGRFKITPEKEQDETSRRMW